MNEMLSIIYDCCFYFTIIFNIIMINIYIYILRTKLIRLSNKENIYILIKEIKYDLIKDFELYSSNDIKEVIEAIIQIYIDNRCDFAEDYENKEKIYYNDIDVFIITKKNQIIKDIKNKLFLNYNNNYDEKFELSILIVS